MLKKNYRPEIDGLRAVAVFAVIFYHAKIQIFDWQVFQGGFYGVDIFFVISGYLISKLITLEFSKKNSFSFINFYERRMRRILPMLFFILLFTVFFGYFLLLPSAYVDLSKSLISSIFFSIFLDKHMMQ
jgi:peptidoglycan/LPS O-acetylase OafA/YrhL